MFAGTGIAAYLVPWLNANLRQDCEAGASFNNLITSDDAITFERNCEQCEPLSTTDLDERRIKLSPNPFSDIVTIEMPGNGHFEIFDSSGRNLLSRAVANYERLDLGFLAGGVYFYRITSEVAKQSGKLVRK